MKLATYKDGARDGQLVVVSRDLRTAHYATGIASRMQAVLDDWSFMAPQLQDLYHALNTGRASHAFAFDPMQCMAPLPRSYQVLEAAAYSTHRGLTHGEQAGRRNELWMRQASGDCLSGPGEDMAVPSAALDIDFAAGLAAITGDVPMGTTAEQGIYSIRLLALCNSLSLRHWWDGKSGAFPVQAGVGMAFSPVAVTMDEVADVWLGGRLQVALHTRWNGRKVGMCDAAEGMDVHFGQLVAHAAATRSLRAGTIVSTGAVSAPGALSAASGAMEWPHGYHCIADKRAMEVQQAATTLTPYMQFGDTLRVEAKGKDGHSIFGAIDHAVVSPQGDGGNA